MDDRDGLIVISVVALVALVALIMGLAVGFGLGTARGASDERAAAVKAGAGRYEADPTTGATRFTYTGATRP